MKPYKWVPQILRDRIWERKEPVVPINGEFISRIGPSGGVDFSHERYVTTGSGYETCLTVFGYPKAVGDYWLTLLTGVEGSMCKLDIASIDQAQVKLNLRKALDEQQSRYQTARNDGERLDAQQRYWELEEMYTELTSYGEVMKALLVRIYLTEPTLYDLDQRAAKVMKELEGSGFRVCICANETKSDWRNLFLSYSQQQTGPYARHGKEIVAKPLAAGLPFHFSSLNDPNGMYFGTTKTGGAVFFDLFRKTDIRLSYDFIAVGKKRSGKSTTLKKLMLDRAIRGDLVRVFDKEGEFVRLTEWLGGTTISMDGNGTTLLNLLQILPDENAATAYNKHIAKVCTAWSCLRGGKVQENELLLLKLMLRLLYRNFKFCDKEGKILRDLNEAAPEEFPTFSDLLLVVRYVIDHYQEFEEEIQKESGVRKEQLPLLTSIELQLSDLCNTYGNLFDGHTSIPDFYKEPVVCFDLKHLAEMEETVYDAQLYNGIAVCWDNCLEVGGKMKRLWQDKEIAWEDITRTLLLIDEAHKSINARKLPIVAALILMLREAGKLFVGVGLASQSIRDFVPDYVGAEAVEMIRTLFDLTTYKFVFNQDSNLLPKLQEVFQNSFTQQELQQIPTLTRGRCILSIAGDRNLDMEIYASEEELDIFGGGA